MTTADERVERVGCMYGEKIRNGGRFVVLKCMTCKLEKEFCVVSLVCVA